MQSKGQTGRERPRLSGDQGASLVEYALLVALITLVCVSSVRFFQGAVSSKLSCAASGLQDNNSSGNANC